MGPIKPQEGPIGCQKNDVAALGASVVMPPMAMLRPLFKKSRYPVGTPKTQGVLLESGYYNMNWAGS